MSLTDRRLASRFEIVGKPWGALEVPEPVRVCNLAPEGMLVESPTPLAIGSVHEFQLIDGAVTARVRAAVKHSAFRRQPGTKRCFLVGLEFLALDARSVAAIERILCEQSAQSFPKGA